MRGPRVARPGGGGLRGQAGMIGGEKFGHHDVICHNGNCSAAVIFS